MRRQQDQKDKARPNRKNSQPKRRENECCKFHLLFVPSNQLTIDRFSRSIEQLIILTLTMLQSYQIT